MSDDLICDWCLWNLRENREWTLSRCRAVEDEHFNGKLFIDVRYMLLFTEKESWNKKESRLLIDGEEELDAADMVRMRIKLQ
jgi:hypothetical protein